MLQISVNVTVFAAVFLLAASAAVAAKRLNSTAYAILKPVPVLLLAAGVLFRTYEGGAFWQWLIIAGLLLGLCGDILLLNLRRFFIPALAVFLVGNLCYAAAFVSGGASFQPAALFLVLPCGIWFSSFRRHVVAEKRRRVLPALFVYLAVLIVMCGGALSFDFARGAFPFFTFGAAMFILSDSMLAWNVFVRRTAVRDVLVSMTYYSAQAFIAAGATAVLPLSDAVK